MQRVSETGEWRVTSAEVRKLLAVLAVVGALLTAGGAVATTQMQITGKADQTSVDSLARTVRYLTARAEPLLADTREVRENVAAILRYVCTQITTRESRRIGVRCDP